MEDFFDILEQKFYTLNNKGLYYIDSNEDCFTNENLNTLWKLGISLVKNGREPYCVEKIMQTEMAMLQNRLFNLQRCQISSINYNNDNDFQQIILLKDIILLIQTRNYNDFIKLRNKYL